MNGGVAPDGNPTSYSTNTANFTLLPATRKNYEFIGWFLDDERVTVLNGSYGRDLILTAKWKSIYLVENGTIIGLTDYGKTCSTLDIPDNIDGKVITAIGNGAFRDCYSLTSITIPDSVTSIGDDAFYNCRSLTSVHISDLAKWCGISFGSYDANPLCYAHNLYLNSTLVTDLVIPDSVTSIGSYAFSGCSRLISITIPNSVTGIGDDAFKNCHSLTSITIPDGVTSIGSSAFFDCSSLTSITIPDSVTSIGSYAFSGCSRLISIMIPDSVTSIGGGAFYNCSSLTSVTIGNSVTSIGDNAINSERDFRKTQQKTPNNIGNSLQMIA